MNMNELTKKMFDKYHPLMAIIVYQLVNEHRFYLERRDIKATGEMQSGVPLTKDCLSDIVNTFSAVEKDIIHGHIPDNMLWADCRTGHGKYVWYYPESKRMLYFSENLEIRNGEMWLPGLIFSVKDQQLSVYAYIDKNLTSETCLYKPPLFNINDKGNVCLGSAKATMPEELTYESLMHYWEKKFWNSAFSHLTDTNPVDGNICNLYKHSMKTGCKFPNKKLSCKINLKVKDLLR